MDRISIYCGILLFAFAFMSFEIVSAGGGISIAPICEDDTPIPCESFVCPTGTSKILIGDQGLCCCGV
ncbi:CLUMA_CG003074, isoform A [Clunio marinus]|uniref:CLUMA_CG003074, isoform A n=1 Tax=Clunio marinus TaxID=568069 RepID=A0A1J1HMY6_9DIPT|nr:CLUMA_CG003074, isoform A [Clunio marinus]